MVAGQTSNATMSTSTTIPTPVRAKRRLQLSDIVTGPLRAPKRPKTLTPESKFEPPRGLTQRQIISDLEDMMVGKTLAAKIARTKEVPLDSLGLPLPKQLMMDDESSAEDAETVMVGNNRKSTARAGSKEYTPLILAPERSPRKSSILATNYHPQLVQTTSLTSLFLDWVLLDPGLWMREQLLEMPYKPDYHYYEPGNVRILEFNTLSSAVRIKSTPSILENKTIDYRATGPVIVDIAPARSIETRGKERAASHKRKPALPKETATHTVKSESHTPTLPTFPTAASKPVSSRASSGEPGRKGAVPPARPRFPGLAARAAAAETASVSVMPRLSPATKDSGDAVKTEGGSGNDDDGETTEEGDTTEPEPTPKKEDIAELRRSSMRGAKMPAKYSR
ncbi:hypothetical protein MBLNU230_g4084t1 [Neophaeotheca triangularis]